jgi:hypothetical protein
MLLGLWVQHDLLALLRLVLVPPIFNAFAPCIRRRSEAHFYIPYDKML